LVFAVGEAASLVYPFLGSHLVQSVWYLVVGAVAVVAAAVAALRQAGSRRWLWLAITFGVALFLAGDLIWTLDDLVFHIDPFPSVADVAYVAAYPVLAFALLAMLRRRQPGGDAGALLDALLVTTGVGVLTGVLVLLPTMTDSSSTVLERLVATAYPLGDLVLLGVVARLMAGQLRPSVAGWALCAGQLAILVSDAFYNGLVLMGSSGISPWLDVGWLQVYLLTALAAMHPSARELTTPARARTERLTRLRLALLGCAALLAPGALLLQKARGADGHPVFVAFGSIALFLFVLARVATLLRQVERQSAVLAAMARSDELTSLPNRRTWEHELVGLRETALEHRQPLTIALLDLDGFKKYYDTRGHLAGDRTLAAVAHVLAQSLRDVDTAARYGGDEFVVAVPGLPLPEVQALVESLCEGVPDGQTARAGIATWRGAEPSSSALSRADSALYVAKRHGGARVIVDDLGADEPASHAAHFGLEPTIVFQPIVDLLTGRVIAAEALSRFAGSRLPPDEIFARAWLRGSGPRLEATAVVAALAARRALGALPLHVNVSVRALVTPEVQQVLPTDLTGVVVEITEQDVSSEVTALREVVDRLRLAGATLAIDDFGVGFSNLRRMIELRPDIIKIDRSLVTDVHRDPARASVIAATAMQVRLSGRGLCAEGVETEAECRALIRLGVRQAQGYLFSRPVPLEELMRLAVTGCASPAQAVDAVAVALGP
jgi:diguanylate cyclase (GGDEF)-like protein